MRTTDREMPLCQALQGRRAVTGLALALSLALAVVWFFATGAALHAQSGTTLSIHDVDDSTFPEVKVVLSAERQGRPLPELAMGNIVLDETNVPASLVSIQRVTDTGTPLALVLTIDVSGSMEGETLANAQASAISLVNSLAPADRGAVISFSDEVRVEQELTLDRKSLAEAILRLRADGSTALYDAVAQSARLAAESGVTRRAVVLVSDGKESGDASKLSRDGSLAAAGETHALFYVLGVGPEIDRDYLQALAIRSGGRYFEAPGPAELPDVYRSLEELLRSQFLLTLRAASPADLGDRSVRISMHEGGSEVSAERTYRSRRDAAAEPPDLVLDPSEDADRNAVGIQHVAVIGAILLGALAAVVVRQRATRHTPSQASADLAATGTFNEMEDPIAQTGRGPAATLALVSGPPADGVRSWRLEETPVAIGSGPACAIRLPAAPGVAPEHLRVWMRDGRPMVHHLAHEATTSLGGKPIIWASLDPGDVLAIGLYELRYEGIPAPGFEAEALPHPPLPGAPAVGFG